VIVAVFVFVLVLVIGILWEMLVVTGHDPSLSGEVFQRTLLVILNGT